MTYYRALKKNLQLQFDNDAYFVRYINKNWDHKSREYDHYYAHETHQMPKEGWRLEYPFKECGCRYFKKHSFCVHLQYVKEFYSSLNVGTTDRTRSAGRPRAMPAAWVEDN